MSQTPDFDSIKQINPYGEEYIRTQREKVQAEVRKTQ